MMRLTKDDLIKIVGALKSLEELPSGVKIDKLAVADHMLFVTKDGEEYILRGIDLIEKSEPKPSLRGNGR